MIRKCLVVTVTVGSLWMAGCAIVPYAREVKKKPSEGGLIALEVLHSEEDRAQADTLMHNNCGSKPVKILEEGEAVVGQRTQTNANASHRAGLEGKKFGNFMIGGSDPSTEVSSSSVTSEVKEWQISYQCVAGNTAKPERVAGRTKTK